MGAFEGYGDYEKSEQQAVPVAQIDWRLIAKAAGEHGVRYRTNAALLAFLAAVEPALPCKSGEGAGERTVVEEAVATSVDDAMTRAFIAGWNATREHADFDMALHYWMLASVTLPDATQTREAELVGVSEEWIVLRQENPQTLTGRDGEIASQAMINAGWRSMPEGEEATEESMSRAWTAMWRLSKYARGDA